MGVQKKDKSKYQKLGPQYDAAELLVFDRFPHRAGVANRAGGGGPEGPVLWT